ncbi:MULTISPECIES: serine/threonine-protein kinase [unclassified Streptomyces]|uniref:serine/threonine-protein kinase n=1 Tax=Streptomyces sp. NPDC127129 TaxID=3345373 RepID=UPI0036260141
MPGSLEPRGDRRTPEEAALAEQLTALFDSLDISYRRYAAGRPYDHSTVYRYLRGERPPTWGFIHDLLYAVAEAQGSVPTAEAIGLFRKLHNDVLRAGGNPRHKVLFLEQQLAEAHRRARQAAVREQHLTQAVEEHQNRIRSLELGHRELEAATAATAAETEDERAQLYAEIEDLKVKLVRARKLHQQAEERCAQLERQLAESEAEAQRASLALSPRPDETEEERRNAAEEAARIVQAAKEEAQEHRAKAQEELHELQQRKRDLDEELSRNLPRPGAPLPPRLLMPAQTGFSSASVGSGPDENLENWAGIVVAGRYRLERELGRGGMGRVWEALDTETDRTVALKGLREVADPVEREEWLRRARREAQALSLVRHQHVVGFQNVVEESGQVWVVMELFAPRTLGDVLREHGPLTVMAATDIGIQILQALRAVHEAGVVHRDVKPDNILFHADGSARLMDFGIATYTRAPRVTQVGTVIGALEYLAPELVLTDPEERRSASPASDLWSLGVALYEMVEGRRPFEGVTDFEILQAVRESQIPPMRFAGRLGRPITLLLRKDPDRRPTTNQAESLLEFSRRDGTPPHGYNLDELDRNPKEGSPRSQQRETPGSTGLRDWLSRLGRRSS